MPPPDLFKFSESDRPKPRRLRYYRGRELTLRHDSGNWNNYERECRALLTKTCAPARTAPRERPGPTGLDHADRLVDCPVLVPAQRTGSIIAAIVSGCLSR